MTNQLHFSCLLTVGLIAFGLSAYAQTVTDVPLPNVSTRANEAATAVKNTVSAAEAGKLPTAEEIAAERARLEKMKAQLAAERAALEQYRADLVRRQQEAAEAAAKAEAEAAELAEAERAAKAAKAEADKAAKAAKAKAAKAEKSATELLAEKYGVSVEQLNAILAANLAK